MPSFELSGALAALEEVAEAMRASNLTATARNGAIARLLIAGDLAGPGHSDSDRYQRPVDYHTTRKLKESP